MTDRYDQEIAALQARVDRLESDVASLRAAVGAAHEFARRAAAAAPPSPTGAPGTWMPPPPTGPPISLQPFPPPPSGAGHHPRPPYVPWRPDSEALLTWGGVALVVLAVIFAVSTAISRGWLGPTAQLAGALALAGALIAGGLRLRPARMPWAHALCTGGVLALQATFASSLFRDAAGVGASRAGVVAATALGVALAAHVPSPWVLGATVLGGHAAWLGTASANEPPYAATVIWLAVLTAAALALATRQRMHGVRLLTYAAAMLVLPAVALLSGSLGGGLAAAASVAIVTSLIVVPNIGDRRSDWHQVEVLGTGVAGPWSVLTLVLALDIDGRAVQGAVAGTVAVLLAAGVWARRARNTATHTLALLFGASVALSIGLALLFDPPLGTLALAIQGAALVEAWRRLGRADVVALNAGGLLGIAAVVTIGAIGEARTLDAAPADDLAHLGVIVAVGVGTWLAREDQVRRVGGVAVLGLLLWWLSSVLVHLPQGEAAVSISWAAIGIALFAAGTTAKQRDLGIAGLAVIGLTVGKLLTVDLREVDTLWRAGLFLVVGLGLMRLGFLLPRLTGNDRNEITG